MNVAILERVASAVPRVKHLALLGCIHALVTLGLFLYGFDLSAIDGVETPRIKDLAFTAAGALMLPGRLLWTNWASKNLPNALEWILFVANSGLWGFLIAAVVERTSNRNQGRQ